MTKIEERQKETAIENFYIHISSDINVSRDDLKAKFKPFSYNQLNDILFDIMLGDSNTRTSSLQKLKLPVTNKKKEEYELRESVKKALNLQDITEFGSNGSNYFKFKDQYGNITIVRNLGDDSKELFNDILNNTNLVNSQNGKQNTSDIFKFLKNNKFIEIGLSNPESLNNEKISKHQKRVLEILKDKVKDRQIVVSTDENLYVVKGNLGSDDIVFKGTYENGHYNVKPLVQKTYGVKVEDNSKKETNNPNLELPNDIIIEIDNNEEIANIIDEGINSNLTDENIENMVEEKINTKYQKYKGIPNLTAIIMTVIAMRKQRKKDGNSNSLGGRQKVLINPNAPKLIDDEEQAA